MNTDLMATFAASTETELVALWERWEAGELSYEEFVALAVILLVRTRARAAALADVGAAADLSVAAGAPVAPVGLEPEQDGPNLAHAALVAALAAEAYKTDPREAVAVLARSQALEAVQDATVAAYREHEQVVGWTRVLNGGACELCQDLAGDVLPVTAQMYHHKGCGCSTRPVTEKENDQ